MPHQLLCTEMITVSTLCALCCSVVAPLPLLLLPSLTCVIEFAFDFRYIVLLVRAAGAAELSIAATVITSATQHGGQAGLGSAARFAATRGSLQGR
jgi:hypothetical protein